MIAAVADGNNNRDDDQSPPRILALNGGPE